MTTYELLEIIQNLKNEVVELLNKQEPKKALDLVVEKENTLKPYLDTCSFTCSDYQEREHFNLQARAWAFENFNKEPLNSLKAYNLAQNEIYNLWTGWKTTIVSVLEALKNFKKQATICVNQQKEQNKKEKKS